MWIISQVNNGVNFGTAFQDAYNGNCVCTWNAVFRTFVDTLNSQKIEIAIAQIIAQIFGVNIGNITFGLNLDPIWSGQDPAKGVVIALVDLLEMVS